MSVVAFVPARSGSKRLPGKNMRPLGGRPLLFWTLEAFLGAESVDRVIFSTDSEEYWDKAVAEFGADRLSLDFRSPEEAGDKVKIFDYLKDARDKILRPEDEVFLLGLPTVPLRRATHVEEALTLFHGAGKPVFSATEYGFPISFGFYLEKDGAWTPVVEPSPLLTGNTRSQDQRPAYHPNGAIYVRAARDLGKPDMRTLYDGAVPYVMDRESSVDIDNEADFLVAEAIMAARVG